MKTIPSTHIVVLGLVGVTIVGLGTFILLKPQREYWAGYKIGAAEAETELREGKAIIYVYGLRPESENEDPETGLPVQVIAGCLVDQRIVGRAAGHNERIAEYIKKHGFPGNSDRRGPAPVR